MNRFSTLIVFVIFAINGARAQMDVPTSTLLGKPFGTKIEIVETIPSRSWLVTNPIEITAIDGNSVTEPIIMEVRPDDKSGKIEKGYRYKFVGYESGGFEGPPDWLSPHVQQPFQFRHFFIVTELVEKKATSVSTLPAR